ncbi:MAG: heat-inducible transcription repressor HrcA [Armatimonadetes bacterium]|nr:heat-inducible transcription repressor HrcA [Armatimonadota bacterium]
MDTLDPRKQSILRAVVIEYVLAAEPVPSELIASKYELGVRSATVRNEMVEITDLGFLEKPHTSAGRIPSDGGYRYFVDHMSGKGNLKPDERSKITSVVGEQETTRELVRETTKALSRATNLLTAALTVRDGSIPIRNAIITVLGPNKALLVLILQNGHSENRVIECPEGLTIEQVGQANEILEKTFGNQSLISAAKSKLAQSGNPIIDSLVGEATKLIRAIAKELTSGHLVIEGEEYLFSQPEFRRDPELFDSLLMSLGNEGDLKETLDEEDKAISIGSENLRPEHWPLSILRQSFFVGDQQGGVLAIIGPKRMDYSRNVAMLDFTADAITKTLTRLFG